MNNLSYLLFGFLIMLGIFLLGREVYCWYFKINERVRLLEETNELLSRQNKLFLKFDKVTSENNSLNEIHNDTKTN